MLGILDIEMACCYMMPLIPERINETSVICIICNDLILGDLGARFIFIVSTGYLKDFLHIFASKRCVTMFSCDGWTHITENHCVVP